jgi:hypothetical protein
MHGKVPGKAKVEGDSVKNDTVQINVSPGELVIPRTVVKAGPSAILKFAIEALEKDQKNFYDGGKVKEDESVWDKFANAFEEEKPKAKKPVPSLDKKKAREFSSVFNSDDYAKGGVVDKYAGWEDVSHELNQDKYAGWEDVSHELQKPEPREVEAGLQAFGDAATLGYLPHLQAAAEKPSAWLVEKIASTDLGSKLLDVPKDAKIEADDYVTARDGFLKRQERLQKENPGAFMAGGVAGTLVNAGATAPLLSAKAATAGARIGKGALQGLTLGAIQNPGDVEGELNDPTKLDLQIAERAPNALLGLGLGAGTTGIVEGVSTVAQKSGNFLKKLANEKAVKATGAMKGDFKTLGPEKVQQMGSDLLEDGIVTPLARPKVISERLNVRQSELIGELEGYLSQADNLGLKKSPEDLKADALRILAKKFPDIPASEMETAVNKIDNWLVGRKDMGAKDMQKFKVSMNPFLDSKDFANDYAGMAKEGLKSLRSATKQGIEDQANLSAEMLGQSGGKIKNVNQKLGSFFGAEDLTEDALARDSANRAFGLTDTILGGVGGAGVFAASQDPSSSGVTGLALALGNKAARSYGNPLMATGFKKASQELLKIPKFAELAQNNPTAFQALVQNVANSPKFKRTDVPSPQKNRPILDMLSENPELLEKIENQKLREAYRKQIENKGSTQEVKDPRQSFLEGN